MTQNTIATRMTKCWAQRPTCGQIVRPMGQHEAIEDKGNPALMPF